MFFQPVSVLPSPLTESQNVNMDLNGQRLLFLYFIHTWELIVLMFPFLSHIKIICSIVDFIIIDYIIII